MYDIGYMECQIEELKEKNEKLVELVKRLVNNAPNTYSGTDIMKNQSKMFAFSSAMNEAKEMLAQYRLEVNE